ncbi:MAG TPA: putative baseplate assembly protein [Solirubrobacteraceae bacterium]
MLVDRDFQSLVDEARLRIGQHCPEWSDHNVSDPGITLVEQFAWMTEILLYRVNRIPERVHLAVLELMGVLRRPPEAARADVRFTLAGPPKAPVVIPALKTEVATVPTESTPAVVFQVTDAVTIPVLELASAATWRDRTLTAIPTRDGVATPPDTDRAAFSSPPRAGDALYLGFRDNLARLAVRVHVQCTPARGVGIRPSDPPWVWEASDAQGVWHPVEVLADTTGGLNYGDGAIDLQVSERSGRTVVGEHKLYWLRVRLIAAEPDPDSGVVASYAEPPRLRELSASALGALVRTQNATIVENEVIGVSDGTAGQAFRVRHRPVLPLKEGETLEVADPATGKSRTWKRVDTLADSDAHDTHYIFDAAAGEVRLGVAIREPLVRRRPDADDDELPQGGGWVRHGAVPPAGAQLILTRYRHGGGNSGNVAAGTLTVLRTAVPGVKSVSNPQAASGGVDLEPLAALRTRAGDELRTRNRAVTAGDFKWLAMASSPQVARAYCGKPGPGEAVPVRILPAVGEPRGFNSFEELTAPGELREEVRRYLEERALLGTSVHVTPVPLRGISVAMEVQIAPSAQPARVERNVLDALYTYLNPLIGGDADGASDGWPFGRPLGIGELELLARRVDGVQFVTYIRVHETDLATRVARSEPITGVLTLAPDEVVASGWHAVRARRKLER